MPTLVQIDSCLAKGSTGRITEAIGAIMKQQGWDCYVVHGARYIGKSKLKSLQVVSKLQEYLHAFGSMLFDRHGLFSHKETTAVINKLREIKPDIIQLHCVHGYYINYKLLFEYLKETNIPVVWTFHDCWSFTGHCAHFAFAGCDKWKNGCYKCPLLKSYPKTFFIDNSEKNWKQKHLSFTSLDNMHIVLVSEWLLNLAKQSFFNKYPMQIIYNGVDVNVFKPLNDASLRIKYGIKESDFMMVACATAWSEYKGIYDYIELSKHINDDYKLILVGVDDIWKKKLPSNVITIPRTENIYELTALYSSADVVLNLSYQESFGLTTIEGFACGTPGIVYNVTASPELITGNTGIIVEPGDINGILSAIETIKRNGKEHYKEYCRKRAVECYDKNMRFEEYSVLYNNLLKY